MKAVTVPTPGTRRTWPLADTTGHVGLAGDDPHRQLERRVARALLLDA
jgi:hypothetical protein